MLIQRVMILVVNDAGNCSLTTEADSSITVEDGKIYLNDWPSLNLSVNQLDRAFFSFKNGLLHIHIKNEVLDGYTAVPLALVEDSLQLRQWIEMANFGTRRE